MIIDCHGHYTTAPADLDQWRQRQLAAAAEGSQFPAEADLKISDDQLRESLEASQVKLQRERGSDLTFFSPRASTMGHHLGNERASLQWSEVSNNLIKRLCDLCPQNFVGVGMLPQFPGAAPEHCIPELERCIDQLGFVGVNLNPDPTGGYWTDPPLFDKSWYPLYERIVALDVPVMVHVTQSRNPNFHFTGAHYMAADTTAFMQFITSDLFKDFPTLKMVIPHGGGAVPYHWGRYRGLCQDLGKGDLDELLLQNVYFDTCVYHTPGMEMLLKVIPLENVLFASEMVGAVRGIDPRTGHYYDDTKRYIDAIDWLTEADRQQLFEGNVRRVYNRFNG